MDDAGDMFSTKVFSSRSSLRSIELSDLEAVFLVVVVAAALLLPLLLSVFTSFTANVSFFATSVFSSRAAGFDS